MHYLGQTVERVLQVGGYRDLTVCMVFEDTSGLRIIGEIQVTHSDSNPP